MRARALILTMLALPAFADFGRWGSSYGEPRTLRFGEITCRQEVRGCDKMTLICRRGSEDLFTANDFADVISASEDSRFIVGLSNRGSTNAFWIRDLKGRVIARRTHSISWDFHDCTESVTNVREWFDEKNPAVRFQLNNGKLSQVVVRGCDGKDLELLSWLTRLLNLF